jgi:hypothetical protein
LDAGPPSELGVHFAVQSTRYLVQGTVYQPVHLEVVYGISSLTNEDNQNIKARDTDSSEIMMLVVHKGYSEKMFFRLVVYILVVLYSASCTGTLCTHTINKRPDRR